MNQRTRLDRLGEINYNQYNGRMEIVQYNNAHDIIVKFENGYKVKAEYKNFKKGTIKNPYDKTIYGIGYLGEGKYITILNKQTTIQYQCWIYMLDRCYKENYQEKRPTYKDCSVCEEWHNFQVFAKWFDENCYTVDDEVMCLDKDILVKGNKRYSPETCVFVPNRINVLFTKTNKNRGKYPIGVYYKKSNNKFTSQLSILNKNGKQQKYLGLFDTPEQAYNVYKKEKEKYIKQIANNYKDKIPLKLYEAMYKYEVEITD